MSDFAIYVSTENLIEPTNTLAIEPTRAVVEPMTRIEQIKNIESLGEGEMILDQETSIYSFICPWCSGLVEVHSSQLNCRIFRHAIMIDSLEPINPHSPENVCNELVEKNLVYGCGKPFRISENNKVDPCDYI